MGVCGGSAVAGTVAGWSGPNERDGNGNGRCNKREPAASKASSPSGIGKPMAPARAAPLAVEEKLPVTLALFDAIVFVTAAAIVLADVAEGRLETVEAVTLRWHRLLGIGTELANRALESSIFSQIFGSAAVSPPVLEVSGNSDSIFAAASPNVVKTSFALSSSNGASPLIIGGADLGLIAICLHQRLALGNRILLGDRDTHAQCNRRNGENGR